VLQAGYAGYVVGVLYLVLWPQPDAAGSGVQAVLDVLDGVGLSWVSESQVEKALNVVLFVPLGLIGWLLWPRLQVLAWAAIGLAFSAFLESTQALFLPGRTPSVSDLVANTSGAVLGALVLRLSARMGRASHRTLA
jgi:hypothetical protein